METELQRAQIIINVLKARIVELEELYLSEKVAHQLTVYHNQEGMSSSEGSHVEDGE